VVTIHRLLGANQGLKIENSALAERQFQLNAMRQDGLKIADAQDFAFMPRRDDKPGLKRPLISGNLSA